MTGILRGLLDGCASAQNNQVGERNPLAARLRVVELFLDALKTLQHSCQLSRLVNFPVFLRGESDTCPVGPAALVGTTEGRGRRPGGRDQLGDRQSRSKNLALKRRDVLFVNQFVRDRGDGVLPQKLFFRHVRTEIARAGTHVAVGQLKPGAGEGVRELLGIIVVSTRNRLISRVKAKGEVGCGHHRSVLLRRVVGVNHHVLIVHVFGQPLVCAGRALDQLPFVFEQHL